MCVYVYIHIYICFINLIGNDNSIHYIALQLYAIYCMPHVNIDRESLKIKIVNWEELFILFTCTLRKM
jgi:hypothetical protein